MQTILLLALAGGALLLLAAVTHFSGQGSLNNIKSKTVGDGQHGTARWATKKEIQQTYAHVPFRPEEWRKGEHLPKKQGLVLGCEGRKDHVIAIVDTDDIHALVTAASGAGKTAYFLYPNIEYALATGMSFLCTDTKGDLFRNYAGIAKECYGLSNRRAGSAQTPTRSDGNNLLHLINKYMDIYKADPKNLPAKAKAEKYAKILSKTLINTTGDSSQYGQNAYFYDAAEGLLTSMLLLVAEYLPTEDAEGRPIEERHIVSVFKLVQELLAPSGVKGKNQFQLLLTKLPPDHKAKWFAGAALNTSEQAMMSVISTVLSRLNAFLDSEMEQILCFDTAIDAETFCNKKSAIFIVLPEEDQTKYFMVSLILQNLYREILTVADENGGFLSITANIVADEPDEETFTVTFDSNGGSSVNAQTVESGKTVAKPADPTRNGYDFEGWFTDEDLTIEYDFDTPVTADITLYAAWDKQNSGGGGGGGSDTETYAVYYHSNYGSDERKFGGRYEENDEVEVRDNSWWDRDNYRFLGWNTEEDGSGQDYDPEDSLRLCRMRMCICTPSGGGWRAIPARAARTAG